MILLSFHTLTVGVCLSVNHPPQLEAVEADVDLIHANCIQYNDISSSIAITSKELHIQMHRALRPDHHTVSSSSSSSADSKSTEAIPSE